MKHIYLFAFAFAFALFLLGCQVTTQTTIGALENEPEPVSEVTLEDVCHEFSCRENIVIKFKTEDGTFEQQLALYWPRVFNDTISILPGESFLVEAELVDGKLVNLKEVKENSNPAKTIAIDFQQMDDSVHMMLSVSNPFENVALKFNMDMIDFTGTPHETSSCPILPRGSGFETWPHPIPELVLTNPVTIDVSEMKTVNCVY
ncbi:hypothetical protein [Thalassotalea sp. PS06]|uniref:hypothetical protein n=1 Tax=Thalassotalea sp. PS06 TaxID=2594005 RepID=UPI0011621A02|nr:hypothetical protein [Thalassotalea sp. PS06]QDP01224.1 hypothetical protein FNC98_07660 [Thalassotalea sp. PS06]